MINLKVCMILKMFTQINLFVRIRVAVLLIFFKPTQLTQTRQGDTEVRL